MSEISLFALSADWEVTSIGEAAKRGGGNVQTGPFGSQLHASDYVADGVPSVMPQNIGDNRILTRGIARITRRDAERLSRYRLAIGDIVYSRRGDVERRALIRDENQGWLCGTGCLRIRFGSGHVIPGYAAYYLGHPEVRRYIVSNAVGATMPNLNTGLLSAVPFVLPPLHEQKAIAEVLSSLDDKIELNRRAIVTLETVAQAIFRDWFVDFGPVRRMHEGATNPGAVLGGLIPDPRLATELAKMFSVGTPAHQLPQGWERFQLSRIADIVKANINPQSQPEQVFEHYSLPAYDKGDDPTLDLGATIKSTKTCVSEGVVLLSKLNPEIERVWLVGPSGGRPQVASTEFLAFAPAPEITASLLYCLFRDPTFRAGLRGMATGTSKSHQRIQSAELLRKAVLAGRADAFKAFGGIADALLARSMGAKEENRTLSEIRDYLLPRLMSGKVRVTQAERRLG